MRLYHFILKLTSALLVECRNGGMYPEKYIFYEAGNLAFVYSAAEQGSASAHVGADAQSRRQDQGSELMRAPLGRPQPLLPAKPQLFDTKHLSRKSLLMQCFKHGLLHKRDEGMPRL